MNVPEVRASSSIEETTVEESAFEFDSRQVAEASLLFPARRLAPVVSRSSSDLSYLGAPQGAEFGRHAWDEAGHL